MSGSESRKQALVGIWQAAIDAVSGYQSVANALQAAGLVNDHVSDCFRQRELGGG